MLTAWDAETREMIAGTDPQETRWAGRCRDNPGAAKDLVDFVQTRNIGLMAFAADTRGSATLFESNWQIKHLQPSPPPEGPSASSSDKGGGWLMQGYFKSAAAGE